MFTVLVCNKLFWKLTKEPFWARKIIPGYILGSQIFFFFSRFTECKLTTLNKRFNTCKTSKVEAVITWHVIPNVSMPHAKSVHTVFVVPVVWLLWSPEPKTANFFVCPHKRAFNTAVIQPYPWSSARMTVLNKYVFLLVVHCHQIRVHLRTVGLSSQPCGACGAWKVAITTKVSPSWLTNVCRCKQK